MNHTNLYYDMYYFFHLDGVPDDDMDMNYLADQANMSMPKPKVHVSMHA